MTRKSLSSSRLPVMLIFFVVLIDMISWGMVIPILPTYAQRFRADEALVGFLVSTYSLMQLFCAPILGFWSDRIGRKPVLVISMLGTALASTLAGVASSLITLGLPLLFVARALDGITGGNISTAQSYIADITPPERRAQGMGIIGAAIGLGYTLGPMLGGIIARHYGVAAPFFTAASIAFCNMLAMWIALPETLTTEHKEKAKHKPGYKITNLFQSLRNPQINILLLVCFLITSSSLIYMSMLPLFTKKHFGFVEENNAYLFAYLGLVMTIVQGGVIRPLVKRLQEFPILLSGVVILGIGLFFIPIAHSTNALYLYAGALALGTALANPTILGLISRRSKEHEQGESIGVTASMASLGRVVGPACGGLAFKFYGFHVSFRLGAIVCLAALIALVFFVVKSKNLVGVGEEITTL